MFNKIFKSLLFLLSALLLISCGGGSSSSGVTLQSISISAPDVIAPLGITQQFTATGNYSDGTTANISNSVSWVSSNSSVATINSAGLVTPVAVGSTNITASLNDLTSAITDFTVTTASLSSIAVTAVTQVSHLGVDVPFIAMGTFSDGSFINISSTVTWSSSATDIATISNTAGTNGVATPVSAGVTSITASYKNITSSAANFGVSAATLSSIAVTSSSSTAALGMTVQYIATGTYSDSSTQVITNSTTWNSSNVQVATINPQTGLATALAIGSTHITATLNNVTSPAEVLTTNSADLVSIAISAPNSSVPLGDNEQFTAIGSFSDGTKMNITSAVTWSSSATNIASVSNTTGENGIVMPIAVGVTNITASLNGVISQPAYALTVSNAALTSIIVTASSLALPLPLTQQFVATGVYSDSTTRVITNSVSWSSSDTGFATINPAGVAQSIGLGTTNIMASSGALNSASIPLTIIPAALSFITVTGVYSTTGINVNQPFTAIGHYTNGSTSDITSLVTWSSSNNGVLSVNGSGYASSVSTGSATITASLNGLSGTSSAVTVNNTTIAVLVVTPATATMNLGSTQQLTATATYSDGAVYNVTTGVTWSGGGAFINVVSGTGIATAISAGVANITATLGSTTSSAVAVTVSSALLKSIVITPLAGNSVPNGLTRQYTAVGHYADGTINDITTSVIWASATPAVATIGASTGLATAVAASGTSNITATLNSVTSDTAVLTASAAALQSISLTPPTVTVAKGLTQQYTAIGHYSDGTTPNLTGSVTWASDTPAVATIGASTGLATAVATSGASNITASMNNITSNSVVLTASVEVLQSIDITPAMVTIANGLTQQYAAIGHYSDGTTPDITGSVTWDSATPAVATIGASTGLATVVAASGTSDITATLNSITSNTAVLTASAAALQSISITPLTSTVSLVTGSVQFAATGHYSDGTTPSMTNSVLWASNDTNIANISNVSGLNGMAYLFMLGTVNITASSNTVTSPATVLTIN